ncbi:hypothetical protein D3C78_1868340 [compost metagenome]
MIQTRFRSRQTPCPSLGAAPAAPSADESAAAEDILHWRPPGCALPLAGSRLLLSFGEQRTAHPVELA